MARKKSSWQRHRHIRESISGELTLRDGPNCFYCDVAFSTDPHRDKFFLARQRTIDHWIPVERGGSEHISNLRLACVECNVCKSNRTGLEFFRDPWLTDRRQKIAKERLLARDFKIIKAFTHSEIIFTGKLEWECAKCGKAMKCNPAYIPCRPKEQTVNEAVFIAKVEEHA